MVIKPLTEQENIDPNTVGALALAYLGDAVYEIRIRHHLVKSGIVRPQMLQRHATHYVSAKAQAALVTQLEAQQRLTAQELAIFHRGRNAKSHTHAKNTPINVYKLSTGFEAIFGYLDLIGSSERIGFLTDWCIQQVENEAQNDYKRD